MAILKDTNINGDLMITGDATINSKLYLNGIIDTKTNALLSIADVINNHQKQIDSLLTPTDRYILDITGGVINFWKIGRLVFLTGGTTFSPSTGTGLLGTVPETFRPIGIVSAAINGTASWAVNNWLSIYFYSDGAIKYATYNTSNTEAYFSVAYITAS